MSLRRRWRGTRATTAAPSALARSAVTVSTSALGNAFRISCFAASTRALVRLFSIRRFAALRMRGITRLEEFDVVRCVDRCPNDGMLEKARVATAPHYTSPSARYLTRVRVSCLLNLTISIRDPADIAANGVSRTVELPNDLFRSLDVPLSPASSGRPHGVVSRSLRSVGASAADAESRRRMRDHIRLSDRPPVSGQHLSSRSGRGLY